MILLQRSQLVCFNNLEEAWQEHRPVMGVNDESGDFQLDCCAVLPDNLFDQIYRAGKVLSASARNFIALCERYWSL